MTRSPYEEIGWYPVELTTAGREQTAFSGFPERFTALHWHGDMFAIPAGAVHVASSGACPNQAFSLDGGRVVGLQFHLEETRESLGELVAAAGHDLPGAAAGPDPPGAAGAAEAADGAPTRGPWVSGAEAMLSAEAPFTTCQELLFGLLDRMVMG